MYEPNVGAVIIIGIISFFGMIKLISITPTDYTAKNRYIHGTEQKFYTNSK